MDAPPKPIMGCIILLLALMVVILGKQAEPYGKEYSTVFTVMIVGIVLFLLIGATRLYDMLNKTTLAAAQLDCKTKPTINMDTCPDYMIMEKSGMITTCTNRIGPSTYIIKNADKDKLKLDIVSDTINLTEFNKKTNDEKCKDSPMNQNYVWVDRENKCVSQV